MKPGKVKVTCKYSIADGSVKIYVNKLLHLSLRRKKIIGIQSYIEGETRKKWIIEIYTAKKTIIVGCKYRYLWEALLRVLDTVPFYSVISDEE